MEIKLELAVILSALTANHIAVERRSLTVSIKETPCFWNQACEITCLSASVCYIPFVNQFKNTQ